MKSKIDKFKQENIENFTHPAPLVDYEMKREAGKLIDRTIKFVLTSKRATRCICCWRQSKEVIE